MNKFEIIQYGFLILILTLGLNYALHASIIKQDQQIREKVYDFIHHYCPVETVDKGYDWVMDLNFSAHEIESIDLEPIHGHDDEHE